MHVDALGRVVTFLRSSLRHLRVPARYFPRARKLWLILDIFPSKMSSRMYTEAPLALPNCGLLLPGAPLRAHTEPPSLSLSRLLAPKFRYQHSPHDGKYLIPKRQASHPSTTAMQEWHCGYLKKPPPSPSQHPITPLSPAQQRSMPPPYVSRSKSMISKAYLASPRGTCYFCWLTTSRLVYAAHARCIGSFLADISTTVLGELSICTRTQTTAIGAVTTSAKKRKEKKNHFFFLLRHFSGPLRLRRCS